MADLKAMCRHAGFARVQTYIASGNVVFESKASSAKVKSALRRAFLPMLESQLALSCARRLKWQPL